MSTVDHIGGYRLIDELGAGGMGAVHLAVGPDGQRVAVKVLHPHIAQDSTARQRLAREVRTLRRIHHPRVAEVLDAELDVEAPFLVTQFVDGLTLSKDVSDNGPFAEDELVNFGHGLLDALKAVHAVGVVHRDLKPANVMIMDGEPMVIDFGIAQVADEVKVTATGLVMGTPGYLSPEIAEGNRATAATDWWGWAATMAYAASGQNPFGGGPLEAVLGRVAMGKANLDGVPERFVPLIRAALDPKPARRPSGEAILGALVDIESGRFPRLPGVATPGREALGSQRPGQQRPMPPPQQQRFRSQGGLPPYAPLQGVPRQGHPGWNPQQQLRGMAQAPMPAPARVPAPMAQRPLYGPLGLDQGRQQAGPRMPTGQQAPMVQQAGFRPPDPARFKQSGGGWTVLVMAVFVAAAAPLGPFLMMVIAYLWGVAGRTVGGITRRQGLRQFESGGVGWSAAAAVPGALLVSVFTSLFGVLLPIIASLAAGVLIRLDIAGIVPPGMSQAFSMWGGAAVFALVYWYGPGSARLRHGSVAIARTAAPAPWGTILGPVIFGVLALLAFSTVLAEGSTTWWPLSGNPFDLVPAG